MSTASPFLKKIYVSLDSLLDTRMGTLAMLDSDFAFAVTMHGGYFKREQDLFSAPDWGALDPALYRRLHETRRDAIVRSSVKTKMVRFVGELAMQVALRSIGTPSQAQVAIEINVHPYQLNSDERTELLQTLAYCFKGDLSLNLVDIAPQALGIEQVRQNYVAMVMYSYEAWLNAHDTALRKAPLKEVCLYVPRLFFSRLLTEQERGELDVYGIDPFEMNRHVLAPLVIVQYLDIALYCLDVPTPRAEEKAHKPPEDGEPSSGVPVA